MAFTKAAQSQLGAHIIEHDNMGGAIRLANGMIKTSHGLIAPPSEEPGDTHSGKLSSEEADDEVQGQSAEEPVTQVVEQPRRRTRRQKEAPPVQQKQPSLVRVEVTVDGFGAVPSQYAHCYVGAGVLVLGLSALSFTPVVSNQGKMQRLYFDAAPGKAYVYCGNRWTDAQGIVNILMVEVQDNQDD